MTFACGTGVGLVTKDCTWRARFVRGVVKIRQAAGADPMGPVAQAMRAVIPAVANVAKNRGVSLDAIRCMAAPVVGKATASVLTYEQCVKACGVPGVARAAGVPVNQVIEQAGATVPLAAAAGMLPIPAVVTKTPMRVTSMPMNAMRRTRTGTGTGMVVRQLGDLGCGPSCRGQGGDMAGLAEDTAAAIAAAKAAAAAAAASGKKGATGSGNPPAAAFRPGNWATGKPTEGQNRYMLAPGDTLSGLSTLYLGGPQRVLEIWRAGNNKFVHASMDKIMAGSWLDMPPEATRAGIALMKDPDVPKGKATPGAPATVPGTKDPADEPPPGPLNPKSWSTGTKIAAAAVATTAAVGAGYLALR